MSEKLEFHEYFINGKGVQGYKIEVTEVYEKTLDEICKVLKSFDGVDVAVKVDSDGKTFLLVKIEEMVIQNEKI